MSLFRSFKHRRRRHGHHDDSPAGKLSDKLSPRAVFCHYMVGGIQPHQAECDVIQAADMGIDAFVLNVISTDDWSTNAIACLFEAASRSALKLFFSFDMCHFQHPEQFLALLQQWHHHPAYYHYHERPVVSTFWGGKLDFGCNSANEGWTKHFRRVLGDHGISPYFIPAFNDARCAPHEFFLHFPVADGVMNWESWPWHGEEVSCETDQGYLESARRADKDFMMGISPLQFKRISPHEYWYRQGSLTLTKRMAQILSLDPSFVQIQTWNDAGESHYIGNLWPWAIPADAPAMKYVEGFDHAGWRILLQSFIEAYKAGFTDVKDMRPAQGKSVDGSFWYTELCEETSCEDDPWGTPRGMEHARHDEIYLAVLVAETEVGAVVRVWSDGQNLGEFSTDLGLNTWSVTGKVPGIQRVEVISTSGQVLLEAESRKQVLGNAEFHNCNYHVVPLSSMDTTAESISERQS